ncbi:MAG TPA: GTPase [Thermoplasmata archaeon]|nr:GTPase [Thermoplasmata archaeon]HIH98456.1 GTPase [Thermoplasmata archaeon]
MNQPLFIYFVGTAGSGKSSLTQAFKLWMDRHGFDAVTMNLDPGAESLPYGPDVDIRDWISLRQVMDRYSLGPNGAQIISADLLATKAPEIKEVVDEFKADYFLVDTPGQIELFVFRDCGKYIIDYLSKGRALIAFLIDSFLAKNPSGLVSQLLLAVTSLFRLEAPMSSLLSKSDILKDAERRQILSWCEDPDKLYGSITSSMPTAYKQLSVNLLQVLAELGAELKPSCISSENLGGMEDLYTQIQETFMGGEDLSKD